ncbi:TerB family tellurite resistance protein [Oligoflexia bacterium]|nr:TerB family tellurite resistance protein [Oligoflexia bacterium]
MLEWIRSFFNQEVSLKETATGRPTDRELQVATLCLLLEMAGIDGDYSNEEVTQIVSIIQKEFGIEDSKAIALLVEGYQKQEAKTQIVRFLREINETFGFDQRVQILALLVKVMKSDEVVETAEDALLLRFVSDLNLSEFHLNNAKSMVERGEV